MKEIWLKNQIIMMKLLFCFHIMRKIKPFIGRIEVSKRLIKATLFLLLFLQLPLISNAELTVSDFRSSGDALLVTDTVTGVQWLSPLATNTASYNDVIGGIDGLVTTEGFTVASDSQVLDLLSDNFDNPTTISSVENYSKALTFFDVFGIANHVTCPSATPPGACPRTQALSLDPAGDLRALGMISNGGVEGSVIDHT